jgi:hypothetical protein
VRRLVGRLDDPRWLRACYEAGPTGYDLARLLERMHVRCEVIAPSLIPKVGLTRFTDIHHQGHRPGRMSIMDTMERKQPRARRSFTPEFKAEIV